MTATFLIDAELALFRAPADRAHVLPAVIFEFLGSVNWTGKSERCAECLYLQPLCPSSSADILSQLTDRVRRALVASPPSNVGAKRSLQA
jgi:hypothetical protein